MVLYHNDVCGTIFLPELSTPEIDKGKRIPPRTLSALAGVGKDMVFMPLNINSSHWTCLVVDRSKEIIYCYDSFNKRVNQNLLAELADELSKMSLSRPYKVTLVHSPVQKDSNNCGLFILLFFWRRLDKEAGNDYTAQGLLRRRWNILQTVVDFSDECKENNNTDK
ncbi:unnamed protein product [Phytophthora fragariaefolia]|uniref:Unnamed protein product n=1 Tax=Phytophthora fragariaefolia TaxID=1490495 RepID=A0A9W7CW50_9STRA|nr:unnamed protein product [Phytophthora fragariaefolia]